MGILKSGVIVFTIKALRPSKSSPLAFNMTLMGCVFVLRLLTNFSIMVISHNVMTWHWTKDKVEVPPKTITQSMKIVLR